MTLSGDAGKVPVGPLRREGLGYGCQPKSVCHLPSWAAVVAVTTSVVASGNQAPSLRPPFAKRRVWNSFSISLLVRYIILSLSCRFFRRVGVGKSVNCLYVFPTGRGGNSDGWLQLVGSLGPGQVEVIPPCLSVWLSRHGLQQTAAFQSGKQSGRFFPLAVQQPSGTGPREAHTRPAVGFPVPGGIPGRKPQQPQQMAVQQLAFAGKIPIGFFRQKAGRYHQEPVDAVQVFLCGNEFMVQMAPPCVLGWLRTLASGIPLFRLVLSLKDVRLFRHRFFRHI